MAPSEVLSGPPEIDAAALHAQLSPEGYLEETFTAEIMTATWRLRRCRIVEAAIPFDPIADDLISSQQKSVDRARAQAHNILHRSLAELRKLQTERAIRLQLDAQSLPALTGIKQVDATLKAHDRQRLLARKADDLDTLEGLITQADKQLCMEVREAGVATEPEPAAPGSSFCKNVPEPSGNAPCHCNSGLADELARPAPWQPYPHERSFDVEAAGQCCARTGAGWPGLAA